MSSAKTTVPTVECNSGVRIVLMFAHYKHQYNTSNNTIKSRAHYLRTREMTTLKSLRPTSTHSLKVVNTNVRLG